MKRRIFCFKIIALVVKSTQATARLSFNNS